MKQDNDRYTRDFLDGPKRGRPRKPDAKTPAERARDYRARKHVALAHDHSLPKIDVYQAFYACKTLTARAGLTDAQARAVVQALWPGVLALT